MIQIPVFIRSLEFLPFVYQLIAAPLYFNWVVTFTAALCGSVCRCLVQMSLLLLTSGEKETNTFDRSIIHLKLQFDSVLSFGIPVSSCFAGFLLCGGSFQPSGIMLPSGICQVLPASQRACKLYWQAGTAGFSLSLPCTSWLKCCWVALYDLFFAHTVTISSVSASSLPSSTQTSGAHGTRILNLWNIQHGKSRRVGLLRWRPHSEKFPFDA